MIIHSMYLKVTEESKNQFTFMQDKGIYLKDKYSGSHPIIHMDDGTYFVLYAYTDKKYIKDLFSTVRNKELFFYKKYELSKEEFKQLKVFQPELELNYIGLLDGGKYETGEKSRINIAMTKYEEKLIKDEIFIASWINEKFSEIKYPIPPSDIFDDSLKKEINKLGYNVIESFLVDDLGANDAEIEFYDREFDILFSLFKGKFSINELMMFIDLFGNTMEEGDFSE